MKKKAAITRVNIEVGGYEYDLSMEEAKDLLEALESMFGSREVVRHIYQDRWWRDWTAPYLSYPSSSKTIPYKLSYDRVSDTSGGVTCNTSGEIFKSSNNNVSLSVVN